MAEKSTKKSAKSFAESMRALEEIVSEIEANPLELEELVRRYEEGTKLLKHCRGILENTQKRLITLTEQEIDSPSVKPTSPPEDDYADFKLS